MAKQVFKNDSDEFHELVKYSKAFNEHNDCAVKAVALAADCSYETAHKALEKQGRKNRRGTYDYQYIKALKEMGLEVISNKTTEIRENVIEKLEKNHNYKVRNLTIKQLSMFPDLLDYDKTYLITVKGHVLCWKYGKVHDWSVNKKFHIRRIIIVEDKD